MVSPRSARELSFSEKIKLKVLLPLKGVFKEIWRMVPGKVAIILLLVLVAMAVAAVVTMPPGFLDKWESAGYWEDNPIVAPPSWVTYLGYKAAPHQVTYLTEPTEKSFSDGVLSLVYRVNYDLNVNDTPQDLIVKADLPVLCVPNATEPGANVLIFPSIEVNVTRPDGITVVAWRALVSPPPGNVTCGMRVHFKTFREDALASVLTTEFLKVYNLRVPPEIAGPNATYAAYLDAIVRSKIVADIQNIYLTTVGLFISPRPYNEGSIIEYKIQDRAREIESMVNDIKAVLSKVPDNTEDEKEVRNYLQSAVNALAGIVDRAPNVTFTDVMDALIAASNSLKKAYDYSILGNLPADISANIMNIKSNVDKFRERISGTPDLVNPVIAYSPLQGKYTITVRVRYTGLPSSQNVPATVGIIVKGKCYGTLGTASGGVDIATIVLYGTPIALLIGFTVAIATTFIGVIAGIVSGYYGGLVDDAIQRTVDIIGNIPFLPIIIIIGTIAQRMKPNVFGIEVSKPLFIILIYLFVLIIFGWGGLAITVRSMTLSIKEEPYIEAARALGASNRRIIFYHIFPQVMMYAVATLVFNVPSAIITEAALSVLGLRHGWPTWGALLSAARAEYRYDIWWWILPPGLMLSLTSLTFVLLGLAIERIVEPRLRTA